MTAETAVLLPGLVLVLVMLLWGLSVGAASIRCLDASRVAARALARGETQAAATSAALSAAPAGARVDVQLAADDVTVRVSARVPLPGPFDGTAPTVSGSATARREGSVP